MFNGRLFLSSMLYTHVVGPNKWRQEQIDARGSIDGKMMYANSLMNSRYHTKSVHHQAILSNIKMKRSVL